VCRYRVLASVWLWIPEAWSQPLLKRGEACRRVQIGSQHIANGQMADGFLRAVDEHVRVVRPG